MTIRQFARLAVAAGAMAFGAAVQAAPITEWTFETSQPTTAGPHAAEIGAGSALGFHASASTVYSSPTGNGSAHSFSSNNWSIDDYYQFSVDLSGESDVWFALDQTRSGTGPATFKVQYSTDGSVFTDLPGGGYSLSGGLWTSLSSVTTTSYAFDVSSVLGNEPIAAIRVTATVTPGNPAGTSRIDNVGFFTENPTPEPASLALLGLGGLMLCRRRSI